MMTFAVPSSSLSMSMPRVRVRMRARASALSCSCTLLLLLLQVLIMTTTIHNSSTASTTAAAAATLISSSQRKKAYMLSFSFSSPSSSPMLISSSTSSLSSASSSSFTSGKKNINRRRQQRHQRQSVSGPGLGPGPGLYLYRRTATISSAPSSASDFEFNSERRKLPKPKPTIDISMDMDMEVEKSTFTSTSTSSFTSTDAPTAIETQPYKNPICPHNPSPKVLVLGSTGRIGRHIIRNLMSLNTKIHVVAFVRDYERACEILYDDMIREHIDTSALNGGEKPTLQVVVMDLVPKEDVAGYKYNTNNEDDEDDDDDDEEYAVSAARFYNDDVANYDFRSKNKHKNNKKKNNRKRNDDDDNDDDDGIDYDYIDPYQPLYDAMVNATAVISTIGTVRETLPFIDYIFKPWRIFLRPDMWCKDPSHPYYVNYVVNRKVLDCAEREQRKRDVEWRVWEESRGGEEDDDDEEEYNENEINNNNNNIGNENDQKKKKKKQGDRLRIIRISDLCVANPPWDIVTVLTNIVRSLVFRSQERCEKLLSNSDVVDTIILRPGDLVDDVRNETCTALQVDVGGYLPSPCYVGREDVADLATLASLSTLDVQLKKNQQRYRGGDENENETESGNEKENHGQGQGQMQSLNNALNKQTNIHTRRRNRKSRNAEGESTKTTERPKAKHWNVAVGWADKVIPTKKVPGQNSNKHDTPKKAFQFMIREENKKTKFERRRNLAVQNSNPFYKYIMEPLRKRIRQFQHSQTKPYGLFVLLPMVLMVYPMICSIVYSTGKRIPILERAAIMAVSYLKPMWLLFIQQLRLAAIHGIKNDANHLKKLIH